MHTRQQLLVEILNRLDTRYPLDESDGFVECTLQLRRERGARLSQGVQHISPESRLFRKYLNDKRHHNRAK
jgi:hypothetical protein